jgi:hypothetical protein
MGAIKKPNSIRTIRYTRWVAGLLYIFLDLYIVFTVDLNIVFSDLLAPLSMLYIPEALVGIWILLVTWAALLACRLPRALNYLGVVVGVAGVLSLFPALEVLGIGFRLGEMVWWVWLGIVMVRSSPSAAARTVRAFFAVRFGMRVVTTQDLTPTWGES